LDAQSLNRAPITRIPQDSARSIFVVSPQSYGVTWRTWCGSILGAGRCPLGSPRNCFKREPGEWKRKSPGPQTRGLISRRGTPALLLNMGHTGLYQPHSDKCPTTRHLLLMGPPEPRFHTLRPAPPSRSTVRGKTADPRLHTAPVNIIKSRRRAHSPLQLNACRARPPCCKRSKAVLVVARFERIFTLKTAFVTLDRLLVRLHKNKSELLMVLDRPEIPLHTNGSENDVRCQVTRRKVSGGTLGIGFWDYLRARLDVPGSHAIPPLPELILARARSP